MKMRVVMTATTLCLVTTTLARGQQTGSLIQTSLTQTESLTQADSTLPRMITLREAVDLALKNNHVVRIAGHEVEANRHAKDVAKSAYFPSVRNDSSIVHVTNTQLIEIPAGEFGSVGSNLVPQSPLIIE